MVLGFICWGICGCLMGEGVLLLLIFVIFVLVVVWNLGYVELVEVICMFFMVGCFVIMVLGIFILIVGMIVIGIGYFVCCVMSIELVEVLYEE